MFFTDDEEKPFQRTAYGWRPEEALVLSQPSGQEAYFVPGGTENDVDGVTFGTSEMVSFQEAVVIRMADYRLNAVFAFSSRSRWSAK